MLVLKRSEGSWVDIVHVKSGEVLRVRTYNIEGVGNGRGRVELAFDDLAKNFTIQREERKVSAHV